MGGKRTIAKDIVDYIVASNPKAKYFFDLFGGGGAIAIEALKRKRFDRVVYNELNTGVTELMKKLIKDGVTDDMYKWVSRDEFESHKNDDDWYGGLIKTCWSFGNNQKDYLFAKEIEEDKRILHEIIVNRCDESRKAFCVKFDDYYLSSDDIQNRRIAVMRMVKSQTGRVDLQRLQQLERFERLQQLERLEVQNKSYEDVVINTPVDETIIYLDPPYLNTAKYQETICHDTLDSFIRNSPYKIYVSSYQFDGLNCVWEKYKRVTLSATLNNNKVVEKLFCNRNEVVKYGLF